MKKWILIIIIISSCSEKNKTDNIFKPRPKSIIIQPFKGFDSLNANYLYDSLNDLFKDISLNKSINLPKSAYYKPRNRYRADSLIRFLRDIHSNDTICVGLTNFDISTTKNGVLDWGVMGLGYRPGNSCIISTFRLDKNNIKSQLIKVVLHEIGHTLNLDHCKESYCLMKDAEGGNPLDKENDFCKKCKEKLKNKGVSLN